MSAYETVIGLEVHAQLATHTKIFCGCLTTFGREPNTQVCPVCLGLPGALPVLNRRVLEFALRLGLACGSEIPVQNVFARKNYFYPDLPKGYQISQYDRPVCVGGSVEIEVDEERLSIPLERIHLEEDAGKSVHTGGDGDASLVDLNRAGVPLVEIVSEPSLRSPAQAGAYLESLRRLVRYLDICDGNMEQGSLRCDANVSLRPIGALELGTKVELKNMNSISGVIAGLEHEIVRQSQVLDRGEAIQQETRSWDVERGVTVFMRGKEDAHDYRYFPDPDLLPVSILDEELERIRRAMPELPEARRHRFVESLGLPVYDAGVLSESRELADYYEAVVASLEDAKSSINEPEKLAS